MVLPNFLVIGAAKAGTTSLNYYLAQHPQIYMSLNKEPRFFAPEFFTVFNQGILRDGSRQSPFSLSEYQSLFAGVTDEIAIGEASPEYLYFPQAAARIKSTIPDVKLIAILRNPSERAFSAYSYQVRDNCEKLTFDEALKTEQQRVADDWQVGFHYTQCGLYYRQLKPYYDLFPSNQIKVFLFEDLKRNPLKMMQGLYNLLGVDDQFIPHLTTQNTSYIPKSKFVNYFLVRRNPLLSTMKLLLPKKISSRLSNTVKKINNSAKEEHFTPLMRQELREFFQEDITKLEGLIDRDLSAWIN